MTDAATRGIRSTGNTARRAWLAGLCGTALLGATAATAQQLDVNNSTVETEGSFTEAYQGSPHGFYPDAKAFPASISGSSITLSEVTLPNIPGSIAVVGLNIVDPGVLVGSLSDRGNGTSRVRFPGVTVAFQTTPEGFTGDLIFDFQTSGEAPGSPAATILAGCGQYSQNVEIFGQDWNRSTGEITLVGHSCYELASSGLTRAFQVVIRGVLSDSSDPCGNGVLEAGEQCDDGNRLSGDCCDANCQLETADGEADSDFDGIANRCDNCTLAANGPLDPDSGDNIQLDTNGDGFGNLCDGDLNNDGLVDFLDLGLLKSRFFSADPDADLNGDGLVDFLDLGTMKTLFFQAPGPAGELP